MIITQTSVSGIERDDILDFIDESVRMLQDQALEPGFIVVGPQSYDVLRHAVAQRFGRSAGTFETYQWLSVVLDPFRGAEVCVLPGPSALAGGVRTEQR